MPQLATDLETAEKLGLVQHVTPEMQTCIKCGTAMKFLLATTYAAGYRCPNCGERYSWCHPDYPEIEHWRVIHHAPVPDELKDVIY